MGALLNRRRYMGGGASLPYDKELDYIECTGTQYINTGILVEPLSDGYAYSIMFLNDKTGTRTIAGCWQYQFTDANLCFTVAGNYRGAYYSFDKNWRGGKDNVFGQLGRVWEKTDVSIVNLNDYDGSKMTMRVSSPLVNEDVMFDNPYTQKAVLPFVIGCVVSGTVNSPTFAEFAHARIYSFKLMRYNTPIFDGIPVRVGTEGYLYDKVSGTLFGNAGTGDFALGPDKT